MIKIAIDVKRAVLDDIIMPALGFNIAKVLKLIVEAFPNKILVIIFKILFLFNPSFFSYNTRYRF